MRYTTETVNRLEADAAKLSAKARAALDEAQDASRRIERLCTLEEDSTSEVKRRDRYEALAASFTKDAEKTSADALRGRAQLALDAARLDLDTWTKSGQEIAKSAQAAAVAVQHLVATLHRDYDILSAIDSNRAAQAVRALPGNPGLMLAGELETSMFSSGGIAAMAETLAVVGNLIEAPLRSGAEAAVLRAEAELAAL